MKALCKNRITKKAAVLRVSLALSLIMGLMPLSVASAAEMTESDVLQTEVTPSAASELNEEVAAPDTENVADEQPILSLEELPSDEIGALDSESAPILEEIDSLSETQDSGNQSREQTDGQSPAIAAASVEDGVEAAETQVALEATEDALSVETFAMSVQADNSVAEAVPAPCSSKQLGPGTYTVTANIYVPKELNPVGLSINAYVTNPANPFTDGVIPAEPVYMNGRLAVSETGEAILSVDIANDVFTVQSMANGANIEVVSSQRNDKVYSRPQLDGASWTGRITHVDLRLSDWSGMYNFGACEERATLGIFDVSVPLRLAVDLANARKDFEGGSFAQTYTDDKTGISLEVSCEDDRSLISKLIDATLQVKDLTEDNAYQAARAQAKDYFAACDELSLYDIRLIANGEEIDLSAAGSLSLIVPLKEEAKVLHMGKASPALIEGEIKDGQFTGSLYDRALGIFAVADGASEWNSGPEVIWSDEAGASLSFASTKQCPDSYLNCPCAELGTYLTMGVVQPKGAGAKQEEGTFFELAQSQYDSFAKDFTSPQIESVYTLAQYESGWAGKYAWASMRHFGKSQAVLAASLPTSNSATRVYLLEGTSKEIQRVTQVESICDGSKVYFDVLDRDSEELQSQWHDMDIFGGYLPYALCNAAYGKTLDIMGLDLIPERELTDSDPIAFFVVVSETPKSIEKPVAAAGLVYNGAEQVGVAAGEGYNVTLQGSATEPGNYTALVTLKDGYVWGDGTTAPVMISWSIAEAPKPVEPVPAPSDKLAAGTYTVTSNLVVPGSVNDIIRGLTAYMTNPKNPLVAASDPNYGLPTSPMADNAKLVVTTDGRYLLDLSLPNPAFTLIDFGTASGGAKVLGVQRDGKAYGASAFGRITRAVIEVPAHKTFSTVFASSHVYAAPLQMDKYWNVTLNVDATSAKKVSDSTAIDIPGGNQGSNSGNNSGSGNSGNAGDNGNNGGAGGNGGNVTVPGVTVPGSNGSSAGGSTTVTGNNGALSGMVAGSAAAASATKLTQGTYTVTCNIWFDKETTGLPLNPHITSGVFPPKDPVSNNAKLRVDANGRCTVTVPISIQHKVMKVNSISGLSVVDSASADGALSSITVDLGVLSPRDTVVRKSCTVGITMGDLAGTISGITGSKSWPATFQLNFAGVPASGGGTIPAAALAAMAGSDGVSDTQDAANAALAALADDTVTADGSPVATAVSEDGTPLASGMGSEAGLAADRFTPEALERELSANPWIAFALGALCTLAVGAAAWGGRRYYLARTEARENAEVQA